MIVPGKPDKFALRLVAYSPNGDRLGLLPQHLEFETAFPLNDVPSLKLSYPAAGVGADFLNQPVEVAVEYAVDGGQWAEPDGGRFLRIKRGADPTDQSGTRMYECPGWSWQLRKLVMYAGGVMAEGKRQFSAVTPGALLRTLVQEGKARGALPGLAIDFTSTNDSAGQLWGSRLTMELEPGIDLLTLLINLNARLGHPSRAPRHAAHRKHLDPGWCQAQRPKVPPIEAAWSLIRWVFFLKKPVLVSGRSAAGSRQPRW